MAQWADNIKQCKAIILMHFPLCDYLCLISYSGAFPVQYNKPLTLQLFELVRYVVSSLSSSSRFDSVLPLLLLLYRNL